ncbi:MAG: PKD domain-containing protein [Nitrososphaerota archaeon]|nr:PKD domain-containing protein [Candidatus Bathyarchaeota archaeon]MDW8049123.1 PKD domain-containing protein [Nitrososphaerota archaeon]
MKLGSLHARALYFITVLLLLLIIPNFCHGVICKESSVVETVWRQQQNVETADYNWSYRGFSVAELLEEREGFGRNATGGLNGRVYRVTTLADSGPGSLREAASTSEPLWIVFDVSGTIELKSTINVRSNKTIDGRGAEITITGYGLKISKASNIIIVNIRFDTAANVDIDALSIDSNSRDIWVHHCDFTNYSDGALDITNQSTDITISWCRFWNHDKVMLIGNDPGKTGDAIIRVTLHHNFFFRTVQRTPRLRFGKVDAYNNYYFGWQSYAIGVAMGGQVLAEANIFEAENQKVVAQYRVGSDPEEGYIKMVNNLLLNGANAKSYKAENVFNRSEYYEARVEPADDALRSKIMAQAGASIPVKPKIMTDSKLQREDWRFKAPLTDPVQAGTALTLYAVIPPYRSQSERVSIYEWNFGDGNITLTTSTSIIHIYQFGGIYNITVSLKSPEGSTISIINATLNVIGPSSGGSGGGGGSVGGGETSIRDPDPFYYVLIGIVILVIAIVAWIFIKRV